ncbi:MAG: hypothetical protein PHS42_01745 [Sulfurimonas sp.]|nr:hypothetical protein [Sulfurimonas sp.]MDD3834172.1 hypothetical protein [Sulfurimonas sp.]
MIDCNLYRENEKIAKREVSKWQIAARYNIDIFEKTGFPVRVDNISYLRQLIDTMNENTFDSYMRELNGLSEIELKILLASLEQSMKFQQIHFPNDDIIIPFNSMMKSLTLYIKLSKIKFSTILDIGTGSGVFSFFINKKNNLKNYSQIEVCESFYMLQNYINSFVFKEQFDQKVLMKKSTDINFFINKDNFGSTNYEESTVIKNNNLNKKCTQYPWWRLGELLSNSIDYDIILSNANLLEFSNESLVDYLYLINKKLSSSGLFIFHCEGSHVNGNIESLFKDMYNANLAPLFIQLSSKIFIKNLELIENEKNILLAPASVSVEELLKDDNFTSRFDNIYVLDDYKVGNKLNGYKIISRESIKDLDIKQGLILNNSFKLESELQQFFNANNIINVLKKKSFFTKSFGLFINSKNKLFQKYYHKENFKDYFNSKEEIVEDFFKTENDERRYYTKEDILSKLSLEN